MDEGGRLSIETMQAIGVLVDKGVVLRDELPADFGRVDGSVGHGDTTNEAADAMEAFADIC